MILWIRSKLLLTPGLIAVAGCMENSLPTGPVKGEDHLTSSQLAIASLNSWEAKRAMPTARIALAAAVVNNSLGQPLLYAIGGDDGNGATLSVVEAYDFTRNVWSTKAALPVRLESTNGAGVIGGKIYVSGGRDLDNHSPGSDDGFPRKSLYVYDPVGNRWSRKSDMPLPSMAGVTGVINGKLYVVLGSFTGFYRYDPSTDVWTALPTCPGDHTFGAGAVINGKFYVAGGTKYTSNGPFPISRLHVYDPATNTWSEKAPMLRGVGGIAGARLQGRLYVLGGIAGNVARNEVQAYDPIANRWTLKAPLPTIRTHLAGASVIISNQQRVVAIGGNGGLGFRWRRSNDIYTP